MDLHYLSILRDKQLDSLWVQEKSSFQMQKQQELPS